MSRTPPCLDLLLAFQADPERSFFEPLERRAYLAQQSGVGIELADHDFAVQVQLQVIEWIGGILDPNVFPTAHAAAQFPVLRFQSSPNIRLLDLALLPLAQSAQENSYRFFSPDMPRGSQPTRLVIRRRYVAGREHRG